MAVEFDHWAMARIERFLADYPAGHLHVVTGFASMAGLAWLARLTGRRPVTVAIGDLRTGMDNFVARDAAEAAAFVNRSDVRVLNWYRTGKNKLGAAVAHAKVFAVEGPEQRPIAVLAGSANLTMAGLNDNVETMVEAVPNDRDAAFRQVVWLEQQAWDASDKIIAKANPPAAQQLGRQRKSSGQIPAKTGQPEPAGSGCLQSMAIAGLACAKFALMRRHGRGVAPNQ
jgi:phosphatidylserine/phosphatidylglycerophosphate/cardiolipin synthase-like enzyme